MKTPEQLIADYLDDALGEADHADFNSWLKADPANMRRFTEAVLFEQQIRAAVHVKAAIAAKEITRAAQVSKTIRVYTKRPNWLARAAAWIGAFHLFSNTAKATTTAILMKKTVTSITAAILVLGGSGIYAIRRHNESSKARVAKMEAEIQSLSDQLGIKTTRISSMRPGAGNLPKTVPVTQIISIFNGGDGISPEEAATIDQFKEQLAAMDAESLKNLIIDADKISNPIHGIVISILMDALILKSPADATQIAAQLIGRGFEFQFHFSQSAADAFAAWLAKDPAAADAWYVATVAAGGLGGKSIAPNGLEYLTIDRSFARLRLAALVSVNPGEAAAMMATMLPGDVTSALQTITDPEVLGKILPALPPEQKVSVAVGVINTMAVKDINAAFAWANSLGMADRDRDALMASGIEAAVAGGKLDLPGVAELNKNLILDDNRRSQMLLSTAKSVSLIPRKNPHTIEPDNSVYWDRVPERIDWLRKEAPSGSADKMVGDYLGELSYASFNLKKSLEAYDNEVSRQGRIDPDLTIAFAFDLALRQDDSPKAAALKLLNKLPPSEKRDHAIQSIEMNR